MADLLDQRAYACTWVPLLDKPVVNFVRYVAISVIRARQNGLLAESCQYGKEDNRVARHPHGL